MRINVYWRGRDVIDVEFHLWRRREDEPQRLPTLQAVGYLADSDRAEPMQPDTTTFGFGPRPESTLSTND